MTPMPPPGKMDETCALMRRYVTTVGTCPLKTGADPRESEGTIALPPPARRLLAKKMRRQADQK